MPEKYSELLRKLAKSKVGDLPKGEEIDQDIV